MALEISLAQFNKIATIAAIKEDALKMAGDDSYQVDIGV